MVEQNDDFLFFVPKQKEESISHENISPQFRRSKRQFMVGEGERSQEKRSPVSNCSL
jgi:hypothetical protein